MRLYVPCFASLVFGVLLLALPQTAQAQLNNQPFSFSRGTVGAGVGMSSAYREIMLERKLLGRSTANNFIRGVDGSLVNVERKGDQGFARPTTAPYAASQSNFSLGIGGASLGTGAGQPRASLRSETANEDMPALFGTAPAAVPINSWIYQLTTLPDLAS